MPQKKLAIQFIRKFESMPILLYRSRFVIAIICALILLMSGCKKAIVQSVSTATLQGYFEDNILNKNFVVDLATDSTMDLTHNYTGYTFILSKTTSYTDGPMTGTKDSLTYTGTWSCNEDYSKLVISLTSPSIPAEFVFINCAWKFTKKALPIMELAPWGTTAPKVLHMRRL